MTEPDEVRTLVDDTPPAVWGRTLRVIAAMHEPDDTGRCRWCQPRHRLGRRLDRLTRWWRRPDAECQTRRVIRAELRTGIGPAWVSSLSRAR